MWQPPGGLSDPPEHNGENEAPPGQPSLSSSQSSLADSDSQFTDSRDIVHIASGTRVTRGVVQRKRVNASQNNVPQHDSSWILKQRRCPDQPSRRLFRMGNLREIQYVPDNIIQSIPNQTVANVNEEQTRRRFIKGHHQESNINHLDGEHFNENLAMWPLKDHFAHCNQDLHMLASFSSQSMPGISHYTSDSSVEPVIPELFNARMNNATSLTNYTALSNHTISCPNPPTTSCNFPITESINGIVTSGDPVSSNSFVSDTISAELTSLHIFGAEQTVNKTNDGVLLLELHKLSGPSKLNLPPSTVQSQKVANRLITHTRIYKIPDERYIWCLSCDRIPVLPVTGQCGHTRCCKCVKDTEACPCGSFSPRVPSVNTVIQAIIDKMQQNDSGIRDFNNSLVPANKNNRRKHLTSSFRSTQVLTKPPRLLRRTTGFISIKKYSTVETYEGRMPMSPQGRLKRAREFLSCGQYRAAATHLARVAASSAPSARFARSLLAQTISALSQNRDPRRLTRDLYKAIRIQSAVSWLKPSDLECVLCYHTYNNPVTTPCGHTYCRTCIERSLDYRKTCALCLRSLHDFNLAATRETEFVTAALVAIDAVSAPSPPDPDIIPIFVCTVAFPSIPCPLFIFDPRYWLMIRRILESGSRKFGMVAYERDRSYSDYGTVLEVCDCVHLEDGRSILSTVGVSRFRVIERDVHDGCDVARIQPLVDVVPDEDMVWELRMMATQISYKALVWLESMNRAVRAEIEAAFGAMPHFHTSEYWWERADGPQWLWWLIAILPLRSEIKILILSTRSLLKRMMAVTRTLEVMDSVAFTNNSNTECDLGTALTSTEDWLERSA